MVVAGFGREKRSLPWWLTKTRPPLILNISAFVQVAKSSPPWNNGVNRQIRDFDSQAYAMAEIMPPQAIGDLGAEA